MKRRGLGKKMAAGGPAAEATGRHHNVREDIGLADPRAIRPRPVLQTCAQ